MAKNRGVDCKSIIRKGKFLDEALSVVEAEKVDLIMVTRRKRSGLSRFIYGSAVGDLKKMAGCKVKIIDE